MMDEAKYVKPEPKYAEDEKPFRMPSEGTRFRLSKYETSYEVKKSKGDMFTAKAVTKPVRLPEVDKKFRLMDTRFEVKERNYSKGIFISQAVR